MRVQLLGANTVAGSEDGLLRYRFDNDLRGLIMIRFLGRAFFNPKKEQKANDKKFKQTENSPLGFATEKHWETT